MSKIRPASPADPRKVRAALAHLRAARDLLAEVGCPATLARVRAAITSAGGAERHVWRRLPAGEGARELSACEVVLRELEADPRAAVEFAGDVLRALYSDEDGREWDLDREVNGGDFIEEVAGVTQDTLSAVYAKIAAFSEGAQ